MVRGGIAVEMLEMPGKDVEVLWRYVLGGCCAVSYWYNVLCMHVLLTGILDLRFYTVELCSELGGRRCRALALLAPASPAWDELLREPQIRRAPALLVQSSFPTVERHETSRE